MHLSSSEPDVSLEPAFIDVLTGFTVYTLLFLLRKMLIFQNMSKCITAKYSKVLTLGFCPYQASYGVI